MTGAASTAAGADKATLPADPTGLIVVLAPHYDDGVFSAGGLIHGHVRSGGRAVVVTVFGGPPASEADAESPLAQALHDRWSIAVHPGETGVGGPSLGGTSLDSARAIVALRRGEDAAALDSIGAEQAVLSFPDCIYRRVGTEWRCSSEADLFAPNGPDEPDLRDALAAELAQFADAAVILAPLGLGLHVDHSLTHAAARGLLNVGYYEDVPYALRPEGWARRRVEGLSPHPWLLETVDLEAKARACVAYASQWPTFWPDPEALAADIKRAAHSGWGAGVICETVWLPAGSHLGGVAAHHHGHPHR